MSNLPDDLLQDIARSSYADMLNDDERNRAYDQAIRICVKSMVESVDYNPDGQKFFKCCDIGTGSGLLSMMIVRAFKEIGYELFNVTAFESFEPMATCAQQVISRAGMCDYITVIPSSSDLVDENPSFDLLVAELLDTELIGEGCLATYKHACEFLCSPNCLFVPYKARIYIEPIASRLLFDRHALENIFIPLRDGNRIMTKIPDEVLNCCGLSTIDDMQVSALRPGKDFYRITEPQVAFNILFNDPSSLAEKDMVDPIFEIKKNVTQPIVIVMWWDIVMYNPTRVNTSLIESFPINLEVLSCAPVWARSTDLLRRDKKIRDIYKRDVWREHWIQGIYYFSNVVQTKSLVGRLKQGDILPIYAYRDSHSLWFELDPSTSELPPNCECGIHRALSRSQLAFLNEFSEMKKLFESMLWSANTFGAYHEGTIFFIPRPIIGKTIEVDDAPKWNIHFNGLTLLDLSFNDEIPWEKVMARRIDGLSTRPVESFTIKFAQVYFENLNRIRTKVQKCEGFDLEPLDNMIGDSIKIIDNAIESHHLWEYGGKRLDGDHVVLSPYIMETEENKILDGTYQQTYCLPIKNCLFAYRRGWALVFWAEFKLEVTHEIITSGPVESIGVCGSGDEERDIEWSRNCKQLVYFMHDHELTADEINKKELQVTIHFKGCYLDISFPGRSSN